MTLIKLNAYKCEGVLESDDLVFVGEIKKFGADHFGFHYQMKGENELREFTGVGRWEWVVWLVYRKRVVRKNLVELQRKLKSFV